jgi:hypothetical protein
MFNVLVSMMKCRIAACGDPAIIEDNQTIAAAKAVSCLSS